MDTIELYNQVVNGKPLEELANETGIDVDRLRRRCRWVSDSLTAGWLSPEIRKRVLCFDA